MTAPGTPIPYYVLDRDGFYYIGFQQKWTSHIHFAAMLSESLAEQLQRRYPKATIEREMAYEVNPKETLSSVGEPEAAAALSSAVKLAALDGMSLETVLLTTERAYHAAKPA